MLSAVYLSTSFKRGSCPPCRFGADVSQRGVPPDAVYTFKHALVQDAAYSTLLRSARKELHAQIGKALETHFSEMVDSQPKLLAQHYADAGLIEKSAPTGVEPARGPRPARRWRKQPRN